MMYLSNARLEQIAQLYLGDEGTIEDAERFADYLESQGWDWEDDSGEIAFVRGGEYMTDAEWQNALAKCFG